MKTIQLLKLSKFCYREVFLESRMLLEQSQQDKLLEKIKDNTKYLQEIDFMMKFMSILYSISLILFPIQILSVFKNRSFLPYDISWVYFIMGALISVFFVFQMFLALFFSVLTLPGLSQGNYIQLIQTLPLSKKEAQLTIYFTHLRAIFPHLCMILFIYPVATYISTRSLTFTIINTGITLINILILFPIVVLANKKVQESLTKSFTKSKSNGFLRIIFIFIIILLSMVVFTGASFISQFLERLLDYHSAPFSVKELTIGLSLFPFFTGGGFFSGYIFLQIANQSINFPIWGLIGLILQTLLGIYLNFKVNQNLISSLDSRSIKLKKIKKTSSLQNLESICVKSKKKVIKFLEMDWRAASRDLQVLIWIATGVFLKVLMGALYGEIMSFNFFYLIMAAYYFVIGINRTEITSAKFLSSLPYQVKDQAKAKLILLAIITFIAESLSLLTLFLHKSEEINYLRWLCSFPLAFSLTMFIFNFQVFLFGKEKRKFTIGFTKLNAAVEKWVIFIISGIAIAIGLIASYDFLESKLPINNIIIVTWSLSLIITILNLWFFNYLFSIKRNDSSS